METLNLPGKNGCASELFPSGWRLLVPAPGNTVACEGGEAVGDSGWSSGNVPVGDVNSDILLVFWVVPYRPPLNPAKRPFRGDARETVEQLGFG